MEVGVEFRPGLCVVDLLNVFNHVLDYLVLPIVVLFKPVHVPRMLHLPLIVLIHPDQPLRNMDGFEWVGFMEEVRRIGLLTVREQVVDLANTNKFEISLTFVLTFDYPKYAIQVILSDDVELGVFFVILHPPDTREDKRKCILLRTICPLSVDHTFFHPQINILFLGIEDHDLLFPAVVIELEFKVWREHKWSACLLS